MAEDRWRFAAAGWAEQDPLAPWASQASPAPAPRPAPGRFGTARSRRWSVLPAKSLASPRWRSRRRVALGKLVLDQRGQEAAAGQPSSSEHSHRLAQRWRTAEAQLGERGSAARCRWGWRCSCRFSRGVDQGLVGRQGRELHGHVRQAAGSGAKRARRRSGRARLRPVDRVQEPGELGLATALVGEAEQLDAHLAGHALAVLLAQPLNILRWPRAGSSR